jgi:DNA-binding response OmpR family regulator
MVILLVEDDVHEQYFVWKLLKADGFAVLTVHDVTIHDAESQIQAVF